MLRSWGLGGNEFSGVGVDFVEVGVVVVVVVVLPPSAAADSAPRPCLRPCSLPRVPWPAPCACPWALPLSPPVPCLALPWPARCPACAPSPPSWITRRASRCLCSCGSVTPGGERSGAGGRTCRVRPLGKGLGRNGFGGLVWVWVWLVWARYFAPSLPTAAAAAWRVRPRRWRGSLGRGRNLSRTLSAPLCGCGSPQRCARFLRRGYPRVGGAPEAAVRAATWLAGAAVSAPRASGVPSRGGAAGLAAWAAVAVTSAGSGSWVDGPLSAEAARVRPAGGPAGTAASASLRSSRSAGVSPAHSGETGERERDRRWWRSFRWGEPSESDITVIQVGMRGGRCALPTTS